MNPERFTPNSTQEPEEDNIEEVVNPVGRVSDILSRIVQARREK